MDKIRIQDLEVHAYHGVLPEEKALGQKFLINAVIHMDMHSAAVTGDLDKTINYAEVCHKMTKLATENTYDLIETLAENLAGEILREYPLAKQVEVEVKKPWAPIGLPLDYVSVEVSRARHTVYIALGSNMGDKDQYLWNAVDALGARDDFSVNKVSDFIVTAPYGGVDQDDFLNGVLEGETTMSPYELLDLLHKIEAENNRTRELHWGPRTLDLDIIFYDDLVMDSEDLIIPHKQMHLRDFVLMPLKQIAPWLRHPILNKTVEELVEDL